MNLKNNNHHETPEISILLPCLNEEAALPACLNEIQSAVKKYELSAEVIIIDNGSSDRSREIIQQKMADFPELKVIEEPNRGYGFAYLCGLENARGSYIFMADADNSYDFLEIEKFIFELKKGADLVIGNRFSGGMDNEAMPHLHKYLGNPFLSFLVRIIFKVSIKDIHCGARALKKSTYHQLGLRAGGMEFASEMIIKASKKELVIKEVPVKYRRRLGSSKLRTITDGWRHLRFILIYSPLFLFLIPGLILFSTGLLLSLWFYFFNPEIFGIQLYFHPLFLLSLMIILGYQLIIFALFSKIYAINHLGDSEVRLEKMFTYLTIEKAGFLGILIFFSGIIIYFSIFSYWIKSGFGSLNETKSSIAALTLSVLGAQTFFSAFMLSILGIKEK